MMKIGFIGTGIMGLPMAGHLLDAGYEMQVYNRTASKAQPLVDKGAIRVASPAEAAKGADIVISIVSRTSDVVEVLAGSHGAASTASPGCLFIDMSTIDSSASVDLAKELSAMDIEFIDAPVSGGEGGAINATLTIFCGGKAENVERARPVLDCMGKKINHMGPSGAGQIAKACNQILVAGALLGVAEALSYGNKKGLDLHQLVEATVGGSAKSWQLENLGKAIAEDNFKPGFMVELMEKDLGMILDANPEDLNLQVTRATIERLQALMDQDLGKLGTQAVYMTFGSN
jgi:3-hydroxyisobutyrate dehydrogenase-like beta-hydroxyacid dehydrogenase